MHPPQSRLRRGLDAHPAAPSQKTFRGFAERPRYARLKMHLRCYCPVMDVSENVPFGAFYRPFALAPMRGVVAGSVFALEARKLARKRAFWPVRGLLSGRIGGNGKRETTPKGVIGVCAHMRAPVRRS